MAQIRIATRKSALAMTQTQWVMKELSKLDAGISFEVVPIVTKGDKIQDVALSRVGGKGLFVSEIEQAMLYGQADMAVHSMKDVPAVLAQGLVLSGIPEREDPRDAIVTKGNISFEELPKGAVVGTSSLRRIAQLLQARPDLQIRPIRGNIDTRLRKLQSEGLDAIVLAAAGLHRMGWRDKITEYLDPAVCLPAIGQGVLGIECRLDDEQVNRLLKKFTDKTTEQCVIAERTLLRELNGSCQVPIAGYATKESDETIRLHGLVATIDGTRIIQSRASGHDAIELGKKVAQQLRDGGAEEILASNEGIR